MSRRLAVVFPFALEAGHAGKDVLLIPEGLRRLGFDVELHCPSADPGVDWAVDVLPVGDELYRAAHYRGRGLDGAVVFSYLRYPRLLATARDAGLRVVAKGDTTGHTVVRAHPRATLTHALHNQPTRLGRAVQVAEWIARLGPLAGRDGREVLQALRLADATVVETEPALEAVRALLGRLGETALAERLHVVPNPVGDIFRALPVDAGREPLVVAIGRWDLRAKDAPLLAKALEHFLARRPDHRAVVVGGGGEGIFGGRIERAGRLSQHEVAELLGRTRTVVTSSHWESFSLSSHEALAMGATVTGPALQPLRDVVAAAVRVDRRAPRRRRDRRRARARGRGVGRGRRDPLAIAAYWRARLDITGVAERYAELLATRACAKVPKHDQA